MNTNRPILKAKRRWSNEGQATSGINPNAWKQSKSNYEHTAENQPTTSSSRTNEPVKNIASARMKRLRESLANELNQSRSSLNEREQPPIKRFASISDDQQRPAISSPSESSICITKRKHALPSTSSSPSNIHNRLTAAATLTSSQQRQSFPYIHNFTKQENRFTTKSNIPGSGSVFPPSPWGNVDLNFTDLSAVSNNCDLNISMISHASNSTVPNDSEQDAQMSMDWSPVSEEMLLSDIRQARELLYEHQNQQKLALNNFNISSSSSRSSNVGMNITNIYVVVDTNIFIDKLQTIINIMHIAYSDDSYPVIYVPWMVIQELDYFKDGYSLSDKHPISKIIQTRCRKAVKFINDCLIARKQNFKGQPIQKAAETRFKVQSPDDSILTCCVQLTIDGYEVILLSSDTNLRNKAIISAITAFAPSEIIKELTKKKTAKKRRNFVEEICKRLSLICSYVLHFEIKSYYGENEYAKKGFKELPWMFKDCIKYLRAQYDSVFQSRIQKQCRKVVDDLHELFFLQDEIVNEVKFMELCLSLLIYLQTGLPKYDSNIQTAIQEIKQLEDEFLH